MIAYRYKPDDGMKYDGTQECQLDPLETKISGHDVWLLPGNCTWKEPLPSKEGYNVVYKSDSDTWEYELIPAPPEPEPPTLDEVKAQKIQSLKYARDTKELEPVLYNNHLFDFDQKSYERITAAIYALDITGGTIEWTLADNGTVNVSTNDLRGVIAQAAVRSNQLHIIYRDLKEQVNACTTVEEVEAITWPED